MLVIDPRINQAIMIAKAIVSKTLLYSTEFLITGDNNLVLIVDETLMYVIPLKSELQYPPIAFKYKSITEDIDYSTVPIDTDEILYNNLVCTYNSYMYVNSFPPSSYFEDLRVSETFASLLNIKTGDGMNWFKVSNAANPAKIYYIPVFSGFPNITSQDKIGIEVRDMNNGYLIVKYKIYKKKINRDIEQYFKLIDITK